MSAVYKAGLRLVQNKTTITPCPYQLDWVKNGKGKQIISTYISTYKHQKANM